MNAIRKHENRLNNAPSAVKEREDQAERRKQNGSTRQVVWNKNSRVKKRKHASLEEIARDQVNACYTKQKQRLIKKLQKRGENQVRLAFEHVLSDMLRCINYLDICRLSNSRRSRSSTSSSEMSLRLKCGSG